MRSDPLLRLLAEPDDPIPIFFAPVLELRDGRCAHCDGWVRQESRARWVCFLCGRQREFRVNAAERALQGRIDGQLSPTRYSRLAESKGRGRNGAPSIP